MTKESARLLMEYRAAGLEYVCPAKAAPVLGCDPYSLNIAAKLGRMPEGSCYFAGRNLRVSVRWLMEMAGFRPFTHCQGGMLPNGAIMAASYGIARRKLECDARGIARRAMERRPALKQKRGPVSGANANRATGQDGK